MKQYLSLREQYPRFAYRGYEIEENDCKAVRRKICGYGGVLHEGQCILSAAGKPLILYYEKRQAGRHRPENRHGAIHH